MKKLFVTLLMLGLLACLAGCGSDAASSAPEQPAVEEQTTASAPDPNVDLDLTALSGTMVYSEVYNMLVTPEDYIGKRVKMNGAFSVYHDVATGADYFACVIADAMACCSQGLEFVLAGEAAYPEDYPELGSNITVTGTFETYEESEYLYCHLVNAELTGG